MPGDGLGRQHADSGLKREVQELVERYRPVIGESPAVHEAALALQRQRRLERRRFRSRGCAL